MSDPSPETRHGFHWFGYIIAVPIGLLFLLLLPLLIALLEHALSGTQHFEDFLRHLGVHDALGEVYEPVIRLVRGP